MILRQFGSLRALCALVYVVLVNLHGYFVFSVDLLLSQLGHFLFHIWFDAGARCPLAGVGSKC